MSRRDSEKDVERPHFYSQYWINIARQYAQSGSLEAMPPIEIGDDEDEVEELPPRPVARTATIAPTPPPVIEPEIDDLPLAPARPARPAKPRQPEPRPSALTSLADLATLSFGEDLELEDMPIGADEDEASVMSRLGSNFDDDGDVQPDEEEAASLESLAEEDDWDDEEEDDDGLGVRRTPGKPVRPTKPTRPVRRPERPF